MRNWKKVAIVAIAIAVITGCGNSVDKQKLADLTAGKSFAQIEEAYSMSVYNSSSDAEIYEYWLKENGKKAKPTFDFELLKMKVEKGKREMEQKIDEYIANLPKMRYQDLKNLRMQAAFMSNLKIFKEKLYPAVDKEIKKRLAK